MLKIIPFRLVSNNLNLKILQNKNRYFILSMILTLISLSLILFKGLNLGIDFTGGLIIEIKSDKPFNLADLRYSLESAKIGEVSLQNFGSDQDIMIRIGLSKQSEQERKLLVEKVKKTINKICSDNLEYKRIDYVGPQVGKVLIQNGITSVILAFLAITIYVGFRFEWYFGFGVIIALIHDLILVLGFLSLTYLDFDLTTIAALLTIIGYSVNDSVVIYDRIRENIKKYGARIKFKELINISINQTLSRTILTIFTTLLATFAIILFGGKNLYNFSLTIFVGIIIGTYSSIFISAPILTHLKEENLEN